MTRWSRSGRPGGPAGAWLWRWRGNPMRRRSDRVEAWLLLVVWLLAVLGGAYAGRAADAAVERVVSARRAEARPVPAVLAEDAARTPPVTTSGTEDRQVSAEVRWTDAAGVPHTGWAKVDPGTTAGTPVTVWTDRAGRTVPEPPGVMETRLQAALTGAVAALGTGAAVLAGGRLARHGLDRHRLAQWDTEWQRVGPLWRKRMRGSG